MDLAMQPDRSKRTNLRRFLGRAGLGTLLLSSVGCMAAGAMDSEEVDPGQTSSELGIIPPVAGGGAAGALATVLPPTAGAPAIIAGAATCASDADCRVERANCSECACQALGASQSVTACYGEKVTCVLDPCASTVARCILGHCAAESDDAR